MTDIFITYSISYFNHLGWMVNKTPSHILFIQYSIYSFPPRQFQPLVHQEPSSCIQPDCGMSYWTSGWARAGGFDKKVWVWGSGAWYTAFYDSYYLRHIEQNGWFIGDNVTVNDVTIHHVCQMLKSQGIDLWVEEVRGRCVSYMTIWDNSINT